MNRSQRLIATTTAAATVISAAAWFGIHEPQRNAAAEAREQQQLVQMTADQLRIQANSIMQKAAQSDELRRELSEFTAMFPDHLDQAHWLRVVRDAASDTGVTLGSFNITAPEPVVGEGAGELVQEPAQAAGEESEDPTQQDSSSPVEAPPTQAHQPVAESTISLTATGDLAAIQRFLSALEAQPQPLLISNVQISGEGDDTTASIEGRTLLVEPVEVPQRNAG